MPQSACMIAFQAAWVSDHGGEGGGRWEGELTKARVLRGEGRAGAGVAARVKTMAAVATPAGVMVARGQRGAGGRREAARAVADARLLLQGRSVLI